MQKKIKFTGLVLKNLDYQDNAQIIYVLTNDNLESILVRGAKKIESKTRPLAQIITKISGMRTDSQKFSTLTEGIVENNYNQIKEDFIKTQAVMCMFEKIINLYPNITMNDTLFNFVDNILTLMEDTQYPKSLLLLFEIKFWYLLGINPSFSNCVNCGEEIDSGYLFINSGGLLCPKCASNCECDLNIENSKIIKYLYHIKIEKIDEKFLSLIDVFYNPITKIVDKYYEKHIDFYNKSKEIFYKVI